MDDITTVAPKVVELHSCIARLQELIVWCEMTLKPSKSHSLSMSKGKVMHTNYLIGEDLTLTLSKKPMKSLGRWYSAPLMDRFRGSEVWGQLSAASDGI